MSTYYNALSKSAVKTALAAIVAACGGLAVASCSLYAELDGCKEDSDCAAGARCVASICRRADTCAGRACNPSTDAAGDSAVSDSATRCDGGDCHPTAHIAVAPEQPVVDEQVTFTATVVGAGDFDGLALRVDNDQVETCASAPCVYVGGPYTEGEHTAVAVVTDAGGTSSESSQRSFVVSSRQPDVPTVSAVKLESTSSSDQPWSNYDLELTADVNAPADQIVTNWTINGQGLTELTLPLDRIDAASAPAYGTAGASCSLGDADAAPTTTTGQIAGAYLFDGVDDTVECTGEFVYDQDFSVEVWFKPAFRQEDTGNAGIVAAVTTVHEWNWQLRYGDESHANRLGFQLRPVGGIVWSSVGQDLTADQWYHVVATVDGNWARIYLDGVEANATDFTADRRASASTVLLGDDGWGNSFAGAIDEVRIYRRALSADQIAALYADGVGDHGVPDDGRFIVAAETVEGDAIRACVRPHTVNGDGSEVCSDTVEILGDHEP